MGVPFSAFSAKLEIACKKPNSDSFDLNASFTLGTASNRIDPPTEPVTLTVGTFTRTIPAGSFQAHGSGSFTFEGVIKGVSLQLRIAPRVSAILVPSGGVGRWFDRNREPSDGEVGHRSRQWHDLSRRPDWLVGCEGGASGHCPLGPARPMGRKPWHKKGELFWTWLGG